MDVLLRVTELFMSYPSLTFNLQNANLTAIYFILSCIISIKFYSLLLKYPRPEHRENSANSERSDECIDFTMMCVFFVPVYSIHSQNNASISNFGGGFSLSKFLIFTAGIGHLVVLNPRPKEISGHAFPAICFIKVHAFVHFCINEFSCHLPSESLRAILTSNYKKILLYKVLMQEKDKVSSNAISLVVFPRINVVLSLIRKESSFLNMILLTIGEVENIFALLDLADFELIVNISCINIKKICFMVNLFSFSGVVEYNIENQIMLPELYKTFFNLKH
ncbi:hypothetical protein AGLY_006219 [Aphis glycines]|uniref:Uncharacterized protein n=1 Tax=Aphis glycines TaxID=307491 RepID=A0A6G0TQX0_APHGL|nr:hypothetical protein AGLY_006219 [Aphis glycines]